LKNIPVIFLLILLCHTVFGQGEIDTQEKILFQNERSISLSLNTNGFGAGYRFGKRKTYLNKTIYDIELAYIKHPKEIKVSSDYSAYSTSRRYVPGKTNLFVNIRPSIGFQHEMFSKEDRGSIAIKYYYGIGPSIGICKPIYYTFGIAVGNYIEYTVDKKYEYKNQNGNAYPLGRASFWKGFDGITLYPGAHVNAGLSFEYGSVNRIINALDVSATFDAFPKKIPIMMSRYNNQFFLTLSVCYRFGWIVDARYKTPKITKEGKLQND
jgi:hypothetical protein